MPSSAFTPLLRGEEIDPEINGRLDDACELSLIVHQVDEYLIGIFLALAQQNPSPVGEDAVRAKRVSRVEFLPRLRVCAPHSPPAHASANKSIDEAQREEITKTERELVFDWLQFTFPNRTGMMHGLADVEVIPLQPAADLPTETRVCRAASGTV